MEFIVLFISIILLVIVLFFVYDIRKKTKNLLKTNLKNQRSDTWVLSLGILAGILLIPPIFILFKPEYFNDSTGFIGDTIGGITAPFVNGLGAILVYLALKAQIDANKLIQDQITKQEKSDRRRDFESSFFQLIKMHNDNVSNMDFKLNLMFDDKKSKLGREFFEVIERMMKDDKKELITREFNETILGKDVFKETFLLFNYALTDVMKGEFKTNKVKGMKLLYGFFYEKLDADYGHYFRGLYRIFKVLDECEPFTDDELENFKIKYHYSSIVRSQLSDYEIYWLFYNGIYDYGSEKFKPLIEKYVILKILEHNVHPNIVEFKKVYKPSAFEKHKILIE